MVKLRMSPWKRHKALYGACTECPLELTRSKIVLAKGVLPCQVLFIGEAPGLSEDVLGIPFIGPAGQLLDEMIHSALEDLNEPKLAFTNLICCIPLDPEDGSKVAEPPKEAMEACSPRLEHFVNKVARPDVIISVGKLTKSRVKHFGKIQKSIIHPAAIMRLDVGRKGLAIQNTVITLRDIFEELQ